MEKCTDPTWCSLQFTEQEAIKFYSLDIWKSFTDEQIFRLQFFQKRICVNMDRFKAAIDTVFNRKVQTFELGMRDLLLEEYNQGKEVPFEGKVLIPEFDEFFIIFAEKVVQNKGHEKLMQEFMEKPENFSLIKLFNLIK